MLIHLNSKHFFKYDKLNEFMYNKVPPTICFQVAYSCNASKLCTVNEINEYLYEKKLEVYLLIFAPQTQDHQKMKAGFDSHSNYSNPKLEWDSPVCQELECFWNSLLHRIWIMHGILWKSVGPRGCNRSFDVSEL